MARSDGPARCRRGASRAQGPGRGGLGRGERPTGGTRHRHGRGPAWWFLPLAVERGCLGAVGLRFPTTQACAHRRAASAGRGDRAAGGPRRRPGPARRRAWSRRASRARPSSCARPCSRRCRTTSAPPLGAMIGAASSLTAYDGAMTEEARRGLVDVVRREGERLDRYVQNLMDMTRLGSGRIEAAARLGHPRGDPGLGAHQPAQAGSGARGRRPDLAPDLPPLFVHGALIEQALFNILENAARFSPPGADVQVEARRGPVTCWCSTSRTAGPGSPRTSGGGSSAMVQGRNDGQHSGNAVPAWASRSCAACSARTAVGWRR
jgi:two-component system sensor histidine kinase KdpD